MEHILLNRPKWIWTLILRKRFVFEWKQFHTHFPLDVIVSQIKLIKNKILHLELWCVAGPIFEKMFSQILSKIGPGVVMLRSLSIDNTKYKTTFIFTKIISNFLYSSPIELRYFSYTTCKGFRQLYLLHYNITEQMVKSWKSLFNMPSNIYFR